MKAIQLIAMISLLLLVAACVPSAEELAGMNKTENKTEEPVVEEVKEEIVIEPMKETEEIKTVELNATKENQTNTTNITNVNITVTATQPPQVANSTIVYRGGAIEMGEGESAKIILK